MKRTTDDAILNGDPGGPGIRIPIITPYTALQTLSLMHQHLYGFSKRQPAKASQPLFKVNIPCPQGNDTSLCTQQVHP